MGGRQGGNLNKELEFRSGIVEGKGGTEEFDFRSCHCGRQEHGIVEGKRAKCKLKSWNLDHGIVEGKREEV